MCPCPFQHRYTNSTTTFTARTYLSKLWGENPVHQPNRQIWTMFYQQNSHSTRPCGLSCTNHVQLITQYLCIYPLSSYCLVPCKWNNSTRPQQRIILVVFKRTVTGRRLLLSLLRISHPYDSPSQSVNPPPINVAILMISTIMRNILSSADKSEIVALFHNEKEEESICTILSNLSHLHPSTPIRTDNKCANGIAKYQCETKR